MARPTDAAMSSPAPDVGRAERPVGGLTHGRRPRRPRPRASGLRRAGQRLTTAATAVCTMAIVMIFAPSTDTYLTVNGMFPLPATASFVMLAMAFGLCLVAWLRTHRRRARILALLRAHWPPATALLALAIVALLWSLFPGAYEDSYLILIYGFQFVVFTTALLLPVFKPFRTYWRVLLLVAFFTASATVIVDALAPGTFWHHQARASGWIGDPNQAAFVVSLLAACVIEYRRLTLVNAVVIATLVVGLLCTLSRGGLVCLAVLATYYVWTLDWRINLKPRAVTIGVASLLIGIASLYYGVEYMVSSAPRLNDPTAKSRLDMLTFERGITDDDSADARLELMAEAVALIKLAPVLGHGTAAAQRGPTGPHNMYLTLWVDFGIAGIGLYVVFLATGYRSFHRRRFVPGEVLIMIVALYSLLSHTVVEQRSVFLVCGVLLSISWFETQPRRHARPSGPHDEAVRRRSARSTASRHGRRSRRKPVPSRPLVTDGTASPKR